MRYYLSIYIIILFFSTACHQEQSPVDTQTSDSLVKEIFITCDIGKFKSILKNWNENTYIPVEVKAEGTFNTNARMRIRGDSSREFPKKSLKIKIDKGPLIFGRKVLNLNAEYEDPSYIHQYLASYLFQQTGHPCFQAEHVRVFINNEFYGLYLMVENIDADFLLRHSLDTAANLYKATKDGACLGFYDNVDHHWEKKINENTDRQDLQNLIDSLDTVSDDRFYEFIHQNFEYERWINILSINLMITNSSTYYHNYYMYHDINNSGKWTMFPWDMDKTFSRYGNIYYNHSSPFWQQDNPLLERSVSNPIILGDIHKRVNELGEVLFNPSILHPKIDSLQYVLGASVENDSIDKITKSDWLEQLENEKEFIRNRVGQINYHIENIPWNFRIVRTPEEISSDYVFRWFPSGDPNGDDITYSFVYGTDMNLFDGNECIIIPNLTDTFLHCPEGLLNGKYYWKVTATDGINKIDGWDNLNHFNYKEGTLLPDNISTGIELTADGSPYFVKKETIVNKEGELIVNEGVTIKFDRGVNLFVYGRINAKGTSELPVIFKPAEGEDYWGYLYIINPFDKCEFAYTRFEEGHIYSKNLDLLIENSSFNINKKNLVVDSQRLSVVWLDSGKFEMRNSVISSNGTGEGINICNGTAHVENCIIDNAPDAIEYIKIINGVIRNNTVMNSPDDAVDFNGCRDVIVEHNTFLNNKDKGISVGHEGDGPSSGITIRFNQFINCGEGISVKDSSEAFILNNTIYSCITGIRCYHKFETNSGGKAVGINNIIADSETEPVVVDELSTIELSYTLCDNVKLKGDNNLKSDPGFYNAEIGDFHLSPGSPAAGISHPDYNSGFLGSLPVKEIMVVINEISLKSGNKGGEWIEIANNGEQDINVSNWILHNKADNRRFIFPENTMLAGESYLVIAADSNRFREDYSDKIYQLGNLPFKISSKAGNFYLSNAYELPIDSVSYSLDGSNSKKYRYYSRKKNNEWNTYVWRNSPARQNSMNHYLVLSLIVLLITGFVLLRTRGTKTTSKNQ